MTPQQILIVVVRILVIFWALYLFGQIGTGAAVYEQMRSGSPISLWVFIGTQFAACVFFWIFPATLAANLLRDGSEKHVVAPSFEGWEDLAFVSVGIFMLARAIPDMTYWLVLVLALVTSETGFEYLEIESKVAIISTVIEILVGLWLVLGTKGIRTMILRLRSAGLHLPIDKQ